MLRSGHLNYRTLRSVPGSPTPGGLVVGMLWSSFDRVPQLWIKALN